ncbi:SDR family NAD(P)-dependent oxidoreductase [Hyphococcus sp. DH-69]|uniref:SDR family NAD(P)-dependent oxidoreductase n=1 Tax=Hyphococcus formosus TaxID=3143534 RepID=UPI00398B8966
MTAFRDRIALVTGAGQGIGKATARILASGGADLALNDINPKTLRETKAELEKIGAHVTSHEGSVTDENFVTDMIDDVTRKHGRIDLLLNNAGGGPANIPWQGFSECDFSHFREIFELNFFSQAMVLHKVLPGMIERGYGKVVCISSISAVLGQEYGCAYASGKLALHALVSSVSKEAARFGVNINAAILGNPPHHTRTDERQNYLDQLSHLNRVGDLEEFGSALAFLLSDDASYITGAAIPIDGGLTNPRMNE